MTTTPKSQGAAIDQAGAPDVPEMCNCGTHTRAACDFAGSCGQRKAAPNLPENWFEPTAIVTETAVGHGVTFIGGSLPKPGTKLYAAPAGDTQQASEDARDAARYRLLRQNVTPADVSLTMTRIPPAGQSLAERIDMLCDLFFERRASQANKVGLDGAA